MTDQLLKTWKTVKKTNKEENLLGKHYAVVYSGKHSKILYIAKLEQRFLVNVDGEFYKLLMSCLKPKIGLGTILEETPNTCPKTVECFTLGTLFLIPWKLFL